VCRDADRCTQAPPIKGEEGLVASLKGIAVECHDNYCQEEERSHYLFQ
jgi:hypothetical protein